MAGGLNRGDKVVDPNDPTATAIVLDGPEQIGPTRFWLVRGADGDENTYPEASLTRRQSLPNSPVAWLSEEALGDPDHFARLLTQLKLTEGLTDIIYSLGSTRTLFRVHQFKPVLKLLASPSQRLLLADEVGLGKTIEAGLIWAEIDARSPTKRVIIACPSGLRTKWQSEMRRRFDREMEIVNAGRLLELLDLYQERGDAARFSVIASYQTLRSVDLLEAFSTRPPTLDLVIADEAHAMRNSETRTHQIGELLAQNSVALLLLSATPVNLASSDLFNLLRLLQPDQYPDIGSFERLLAPNEHVNAALRILTSVEAPSGSDVARALRRVEQTSEARRYVRNPVYAEVLVRLDADTALNPSEVTDLANEIASLNTLANVYTRTRKRDLADHTAIRRANTCDVVLTELEQVVYDEAVELVSKLRTSTTGMNTGLASVMPARQAASCLPVMADYLDEMLRTGRLSVDFSEGEEDDEDGDGLSSVVGTAEAQAAARALAEMARGLEQTDSKLSVLLDALATLRAQGSHQVLLFSFFKRTLAYLKTKLTAAGLTCAVMNGDTPMVERDQLLARFRAGAFDILLSSEIGSEGLDFEFCDVIVNYDLPWNPMRLEQRIGRLDRFGQQHEVIHVLNFNIPGTIDTEIFLRLYNRIGVFERSIGDLEPILGDRLQQLNRLLASSTLTIEEQTHLAVQLALAIERERTAVEAFEVERERLVGADQYVSESLERAYAERRYLTAAELNRYVAGFLRDEASPAALTGDGPTYALSGSPLLADLLRRYGRPFADHDFNDLVARVESSGATPVVFDADSAYERKGEFLHARHAILRCISAYYAESETHLPRGGYVRVPGAQRLGRWVVFIFRIQASGLIPSRTLLPGAVELSTGEVDLEVGRAVTSYLAGNDPERIPQRSLPIVDAEGVKAAYEVVQGAIIDHCDRLEGDLQRRNDAQLAVRQEALRTALDVRRAWLMQQIERPDLNARIVRMRVAQLNNLERQTEDRVRELEQFRAVRIGFKVLAGGIVDFV